MQTTKTTKPSLLKGVLAAAFLTFSTGVCGFASAVSAETLVVVPHSGLRILDPIITTAHIVRNHGYMIYDTLLAFDADFKVQPQMASYTVSDDGLTYTFTLRDGLKWHDGTPVTAEDCIASVQRWGKRDTSGQVLFDKLESLTANGEKEFTFKLKETFAYLPETLAKPSSVVPFMMPKRIAATPADTAITEFIGSGPFKFVTEEYQPGVKSVYEKFADYVPRSEAPSWLAGGKVVKVDRVEWTAMPDPQTAMNAIQSGEIDYLEAPPIDLLPLVEGNDELTVRKLSPLGGQTMGRMNFLYPPFDNKKIRQAALKAMNQKDVLDAFIGNPAYYTICGSLFGCGTPFESTAGSETLTGSGDVEGAKALLKEAGYDGTPVVILQPTDVTTTKAQPVVAANALRAAGFNVELQPMDWQTVVTRRASQKPVAEGGWNMFFTNWIVPEIMTPLNNPMLNGRGKNGFFGWPTDPKLEELRAKYLAAKTPDEQKAAAGELQAHALDEVSYIPLGQYNVPSVWRNVVTGLLDAPVPVFWNIEKTEE
ncbi:ABC transporter substrate-binding protein [Neorhizobium sp. JUb45]|uniref:ABC transporter substrate-binding protein n=1 Tax=unclassified Neorhizobium TaxID=2629175 RepID=UPI0010522721|nr:ABC transporter substrate-binding protein [Neorhizobium sp. JUb45]TCR02662.1 peptide/nickel transport system substrate-binding protein [Neorhizobium sp. JUb45]